MRNLIWPGLVCAVVALWHETGAAQPGTMGTPYTQPTVSPYLNLNRRGTSSAVNYYGLVRPQLEFRNALRDLQQHSPSNPLNVSQSSDAQGGLPITGHAAIFLNTGGYFLNNTTSPFQQSRGQVGTSQRTGQSGQTGVQGMPTRLPSPRRGF